jgi:myosin heavy subunit
MEDIVNEKFKQVDKTLDNHEERISETEKKCQQMDKTYSVTMAEMNQTNEILSNVLKEVKEAVVDIRKILESSTRKQDEFELKQNELINVQKNQGVEIKEVKTEMKAVSKKGTVDILSWFEANWFPFFLALGGIIAWATGVIKI